ncbi:MAG: FMN-binding protein [Candidatus Omnitrophota bacterium]
MKSALRILIFVVAMGTVSGGLLFGINSLTAKRIAQNEELKLKSAVLDVLEVPYRPENLLELFDQNVKILEKGDSLFYTSVDGTTAFKFKGPGLWGTIEGILSINPDLKTIRVLRILYQEETPGLGGRIAEPEYLQGFRSKTFIPKISFVPSGADKAANEVDAITGATGSSKALEKLLNETIKKRLDVLRSEKL